MKNSFLPLLGLLNIKGVPDAVLDLMGENMIKRRPSPATGVQQCSSARVGSAREARAATEEVSVNWKGEMHEVELCHV